MLKIKLETFSNAKQFEKHTFLFLLFSLFNLLKVVIFKIKMSLWFISVNFVLLVCNTIK